MCPLAVRHYGRGPRDALGAGPQQAAEDARPQPGRDRADEAEVGDSSLSACGGQRIYLVCQKVSSCNPLSPWALDPGIPESQLLFHTITESHCILLHNSQFDSLSSLPSSHEPSSLISQCPSFSACQPWRHEAALPWTEILQSEDSKSVLTLFGAAAGPQPSLQ